MTETIQSVDILLIEDDPRDAEMMTRALKAQRLANSIHVIEDGAQALEYLFGPGDRTGPTSHTPRLILLDLKLPKVSGLEVLQALKNDARTKTIPVVIVTSSRENPDIQRAYELGANSYVVKPVDFRDFVGAMTQVGFYWLLINQR